MIDGVVLPKVYMEEKIKEDKKRQEKKDSLATKVVAVAKKPEQ